MTPEVLVPQSAAVQAFAFGIAVGAVLAGGLAWAWGWSHGWRGGYGAGAAQGWVTGVNEAGVLERLVALDELHNDPTVQLKAGMHRHEGAVAEWQREQEGRKSP